MKKLREIYEELFIKRKDKRIIDNCEYRELMRKAQGYDDFINFFIKCAICPMIFGEEFKFVNHDEWEEMINGYYKFNPDKIRAHKNLLLVVEGMKIMYKENREKNEDNES